MGFQRQIFSVNATGVGTNFLNTAYSQPLPALSTIYGNYTVGASAIAPAIKLNPTTSQNLTCFVTAEYFAQTVYNGGVSYTTLQNGIYAFANGDNTLPYKLYNSSTEGFNTLDYYLSATGNAGASGVQTGVVFWALSSTCLSGTSAGTVIPVEVTNQTTTFDGGVTDQPFLSAATNVWCINTPFPSDNPVYFSQQDFSRIQQFLG